MRIFHRPGDYVAFLETMQHTLKVQPMRILGWCLMPNHWHMVLWPQNDGDLSRFVGWLSNTHVRRYHRFHALDGLGHLYQGRFKSFLIEQDMHLLRVLRYVEANALRAGLVQRAEQWPFSSLAVRWAGPWAHLLHPGPVDRPQNWIDLVNEPLEEGQLKGLRLSLNRSRPYGGQAWVHEVARRWKLAHTLRGRGRPPQAPPTGPVASRD